MGEIEKALYAKVVKKCGNRFHWEEWAADIAKIANTHITRITTIVTNPKNKKAKEVFEAFADELRDDLNDSITDPEVIEMLAQHLITKPVFDALFEGYSFANRNPVSQAMSNVLEVLQEHHLEKEAGTLEQFYASVKMRAEGIGNAQAKQKIVVELYDKFFRNAFPKMTERLGIVYTPVEIVDFIIHSIEDLLQKEFGQSLGSEGVHILDPFTGTGTFVTRLLQSGLIKKEDLPRKFKNEIHANELVLLAYYIAAINIEAVYHGIVGGEYEPFEGICLTDTFQLYEKEDLISDTLVDNSNRRKRQKKLDIRVIMGNPPYSAGQASANDNNQNIAYDGLDGRIRNTYAKYSTVTNKIALYDSYIRAIRWGSDRLCKYRFNPKVNFEDSPCAKKCCCNGVLGFVTNAGFLDSNAADGLRKCLAEEYSSIYVFHLRGNQRTSGEQSRKEAGKIFGSGSRAPIAISLLVKNAATKKQSQIYWHDIGDYLSREEKLNIITEFKSIEGITQSDGWAEIQPDKYFDWINQRDDRFYNYLAIGNKKETNKKVVFQNYSQGVLTSRDSWCYNFSKTSIDLHMSKMIDFYNSEVKRCNAIDRAGEGIEKYLIYDAGKISWSRKLRKDVSRGKFYSYDSMSRIDSMYRPFCKKWLYFDKEFNELVFQIPKFFPNKQAINNVICISGTGANEFSVYMVNMIPCFDLVVKGQCFPFYLYEKQEEVADESALFTKPKETVDESGYTRNDAITDEGLNHFKQAYPKETLTKEDLFYYIYGLLHSEEYRIRYRDNLRKELPRIPRVKKAKDFWAFSQAGRNLADLHLNYESVEPWEVELDTGEEKAYRLQPKDYYVTKMKFAKNGKEKDKTTVIYNERITVRDIPLEAYDYIVNGKPAIEWVMERQAVTTDKKSGIVNDANLWATETMKNAKYPLELLLRVIRVSMETMKIVRGLPKLDIN